MKNKKEEGITLIVLVITITIIIIISGISVGAGLSTVASAKYMKFQAEISMVQNKVNEIVGQYQRENKQIGESLTEKEYGILDTKEVTEVLNQKATEKGVSVAELKNGFRFCTKEYLIQELGLDGVTRDYLVHLENTIVVAAEKCEFEGKNYYMQEQMESGLYNVTYKNQIISDGTFSVETRQVADGYEMKIIPEHDKYVSKWEVRYKLQQEAEWNITDQLTFRVETPGIYEIRVTHGDEVNLKTQTVTILAGEPDEEGYYTQNSTINGRNKSTTYNPVIPKGFKPVQDETTGNALWGDGTTGPARAAVNSGLVIQAKDGSQYVWIPVDGVEVKLSRYTFDTQGNATMYGQNAITIGEITYEEIALSPWGNLGAINIEGFKKSVQNNGGYYIARYEASKRQDNKVLSIVSQGTPAGEGASSENITPNMLWNGVTQVEAAKACESLYPDIRSDLINSYAWDTAILFIQKNGDSVYSQKVGSAFGTTLQNTGVSTDIQCNIHDMATNVAEWTTETHPVKETPCVERGGFFGNGTSLVASRGVGSSTTSKNAHTGFRSILYW